MVSINSILIQKNYAIIWFLSHFMISISLHAQKKYDQLSLELKLGASIPLSLTDNTSKSDYLSLNSFQVGSRYMITQDFGILGTYTYQTYGNNSNGLDFHQFSLEGVVSLSQWLSAPYYIKEFVNLQVHGGAGLALAKPSSSHNYDRLGIVTVGGTLLVKLSSKLALTGDLTYTYQLSQLYGYDGELLNTNKASENGSKCFIGVGITLYLGREKHHADWY